MKILDRIIVQVRWRTFVRLGYDTRKNNKDGLVVWRDHSLGLSDSINYEWTKLARSISKDLKTAGVNQDMYDKISQHEKWEEIHFIYQLGNIPKHKGASMKSLMQIAYNYGSALFIAEEKGGYNQQLVDEISFLSLNNPKIFINI